MPEGRAVFLDRDGTLIVDVGYPKDPRQVRLLPGVVEALTQLKQAGYFLIVISNQSGIGRGLVTIEQAQQVHDRVVACLAEAGLHLEGSYYCPHAPEEGCTCRKPSPQALLQAAARFDLDLSRSFMVGDKLADVEAGRRAGCRSILLHAHPECGKQTGGADLVTDDWAEAVEMILNLSGTKA